MNLHIECLIDISFSMKDSISDLVYSYNNFLDEQRIINSDNVNLTWGLNLFNNNYYTLVNNININKVNHLTSYELKTENTTSLYDAIATTINKVDYNMKKDKIICVIMTDGFDNSSHMYSIDMIKSQILIKEKLNWKFIYLGANHDAVEVAKELGISTDCALTYKQNTNGIYNAFKSASNSITKLRKGDINELSFNDLDRFSSLSL